MIDVFDPNNKIPYVVYVVDGIRNVCTASIMPHWVVKMKPSSRMFNPNDKFELMFEDGPVELTLIGIDADTNLHYYHVESLTPRTL